jgi:glycosidase
MWRRRRNLAHTVALGIALILARHAGAQASRVAAIVPAWTRGAVCYEVFVRSFFDSDGDGIGDLNGLIAKLDYINDGNPRSRTSLGASCIWLMPIMPSPSYHGYDVTDYYGINPAYGTRATFKRLVAEAHRRGIKILIDMVLNHTSSQHPDFQAALRDTASPYRAWYRFAPVPAGPGPWGAVAWHRSPVRDEYYYGVFSAEMPDLNYDTPAVRQEANRIATFWLRDMGVDGFRLDAVPYLVEQGSCMIGCPGTHQLLREYAEHVDSVLPGAYTVGEVWGDIDTVLPYYPDQLTSYFGFALADSIVSAVRHGDARGVLAGYLRLQDTLPAYRWSPILSNHDGTRSMTLFGGEMQRARAAAALLLTLPGLPFVYYGEEIGMTGDKPDPRLRTPMQWDTGALAGFTRGTPWEALQPGWRATNVATESRDPGSLLNLYRRLIHLRHEHVALADGRLIALTSSDTVVVAYLRRSGPHVVLVLVNLGSANAVAVSVSSHDSVVERGRYALRDVLSGARGAPLNVDASGAIRRFMPAPGALAPGDVRIFELQR